MPAFISWLYMPAKTPKATLEMLSSELRKVVGDPALKQRFINIGYDPTPTSSEDMVPGDAKRPAPKWTPLIKRLNIKLD